MLVKQSIRLSQNFLKNPALTEDLITNSSIKPEDTVLDIGAGSGSITKVLAARAKRVIAYEADERLATNLIAQYVVQPQVEIVMGDFLASPLPTEAYKVFANIPFNLTSDIVRKLLDGFNPPVDCYLILQREAALKFTGEPGKQSLFSALHGPWFDMNIVHEFKASDFTPEPKVKTVLLQIQQRSESLINASESDAYRDFVSYVFNHANPNIFPSLQKLFPGKQFDAAKRALGDRVTAKPSQLQLHDWIALFTAFAAAAGDAQQAPVRGAASKLQQEAKTIEKHHRTRSAANWRQST
jgi:23S rRNA (adenine-N6)-dimethyltransferase